MHQGLQLQSLVQEPRSEPISMGWRAEAGGLIDVDHLNMEGPAHDFIVVKSLPSLPSSTALNILLYHCLVSCVK